MPQFSELWVKESCLVWEWAQDTGAINARVRKQGVSGLRNKKLAVM